MIKSSGSFGISVLDDRLGGPVRGGLHVLIGGPGTGKSVAALQFLHEGVARGGEVGLVTQARPEDVIELAQSIGIDLSEHLREGRWRIYGFQQGFRDRYRRTLEPREIFEELERLISDDGIPDRLVVDTCGPLVAGRESSNGAELLVDSMSHLGSTVLLTLAAEHPSALDSGFDLISQRAALILHLTLSSSGRRQFLTRKTLGPHQSTGAVSFEIQPGVGIVPGEASARERAAEALAQARRRVLMLDVSGEFPEELRLWFESKFEFFYTSDPVDAFPELVQREFGLVVVHVDRLSVERGLHVMHQLRRAVQRPPILVLCPYDLRASDRAQALRSGADDFVSGGLNPEELYSRIQALMRRGRALRKLEALSLNGAEPSLNGSSDVREIVRQQLTTPEAPIFSLVLLRPTRKKNLQELAEHVTTQMRTGNGDRLSVNGTHVEVFLHGALASHAERFLNRVRTDRWTKTGAVVYTFPTDREELQKIVDD